MDRQMDLIVAQALADLKRDNPKLYELFRSSMQDPRQNHIIKEEPEWND
jgi:hypothetical protein